MLSVKRLILLITMLINSIYGLEVQNDESTKISVTPEEMVLLLDQEIIVREIESGQSTGKTVEALGLIDAPVKEVYQLLIDFQAYPEYMPNISNILIREQNNNRAVLDYTLELPLGKIKMYRLEMSYKLGLTQAEISWQMIDWPGLPKHQTIQNTVGYWRLTPSPYKHDQTLALYHVFTDPGAVPLGLGWIVDILTSNSVPTIMLRTRDRLYDIRKHD